MAAYVDFIVEQIQHNVGFLVEQGHMTRADADAVFARLPSSDFRAAALNQSAVPSAPRAVLAAPVASTGMVRAKAIWAYNENGQDADDLSFKSGDIVEIVEETNADWWTGKANGKQGLFPSNHVEKIAGAAPTAPRRTLAPPPQYDQPVAVSDSKTPYRAFGAAHHGVDKPPPPGSGVVNSVGLQEADGQEKKKNKFGKYGNTMAHSAAGGVGFGAGAAIGGGLVRAIF